MAAKKKSYWLLKSEPDVYSLDDLKRDKRTMWEGVRNYQARNLLRDELKRGDRAFFYHSQKKEIAGICEVAKGGYPDPTQFDERSKYHDPKSDPDDPRWYVVDVKFVEAFDEPIPLDDLKEMKALQEMVLLNRSRLSVQPVRAREWNAILKRAHAKKQK